MIDPVTLTALKGRLEQIADEMDLAEKTIKNYVTQLLSKLGLQRRTQAAVLVAKRGGSLFPEHQRASE